MLQRATFLFLNSLGAPVVPSFVSRHPGVDYLVLRTRGLAPPYRAALPRLRSLTKGRRHQKH